MLVNALQWCGAPFRDSHCISDEEPTKPVWQRNKDLNLTPVLKRRNI
jgi:hypothetical protein